MKLAIIILSLALAGCFGTSPVKKDFPTPSAELMAAPAELKKLPEGPLVLSTITESTVDNYTTANLIRLQLIKLQAWVNEQAKLYNKSNP